MVLVLLLLLLLLLHMLLLLLLLLPLAMPSLPMLLLLLLLLLLMSASLPCRRRFCCLARSYLVHTDHCPRSAWPPYLPAHPCCQAKMDNCQIRHFSS